MAVRATVHLKTGNQIQFVAESATFSPTEGTAIVLPEGAAYTVDYIAPDQVAFFSTQQIVADQAGGAPEVSAIPAE